MKQAIADVRAFHDACDVFSPSCPDFPPDDVVKLRIKLVTEEVSELMKGIARRDIIDVADGIADAIYVLIGTALTFGIPLDRVWREVQSSNMSKLDPETGKAIKRIDGKVMKGAAFRAPDIAAAMTADLFEDA